VCDIPVEGTEMEFEVQFERDGGSPYFDVYHIHLRCFSAWELMRSKVDGRT
jgi:hypothetical protein